MTDLLTTTQVAQRVGKHPKTVERAIRRGALRATRLSGSEHGPYGVKAEWVEEWIACCATQVPTRAPIASVPTPGPPREHQGRLAVVDGMGRGRAA